MNPNLPCVSHTRRSLIGAAAAWLTCGGRLAMAQPGEPMGEVYINGQRATRTTAIRPGDRVLTGPDGMLTLAIGDDAFRLRPLTSVLFERDADKNRVGGLRLLAGAVLGAFRKGAPRNLRTPTATIGIRGTAVYVEANPVLTYVCTCYGAIDLECTSYRSKKQVKAANHTPNYVFARVLSGRSIVDAPVINHTNAELADLEKLVGRKPVLPVK